MLLLSDGTINADAPFEKYHVTYHEISKDTLQDTIGVLTISSGVKGGTVFRTYQENNGEFSFHT
jgi:hypothetical protein